MRIISRVLSARMYGDIQNEGDDSESTTIDTLCLDQKDYGVWETEQQPWMDADFVMCPESRTVVRQQGDNGNDHHGIDDDNDDSTNGREEEEQELQLWIDQNYGLWQLLSTQQGGGGLSPSECRDIGKTTANQMAKLTSLGPNAPRGWDELLHQLDSAPTATELRAFQAQLQDDPQYALQFLLHPVFLVFDYQRRCCGMLRNEDVGSFLDLLSRAHAVYARDCQLAPRSELHKRMLVHLALQQRRHWEFYELEPLLAGEEAPGWLCGALDHAHAEEEENEEESSASDKGSTAMLNEDDDDFQRLERLASQTTPEELYMDDDEELAALFAALPLPETPNLPLPGTAATERNIVEEKGVSGTAETASTNADEPPVAIEEEDHQGKPHKPKKGAKKTKKSKKKSSSGKQSIQEGDIVEENSGHGDLDHSSSSHNDDVDKETLRNNKNRRGRKSSRDDNKAVRRSSSSSRRRLKRQSSSSKKNICGAGSSEREDEDDKEQPQPRKSTKSKSSRNQKSKRRSASLPRSSSSSNRSRRKGHSESLSSSDDDNNNGETKQGKGVRRSSSMTRLLSMEELAQQRCRESFTGRSLSKLRDLEE